MEKTRWIQPVFSRDSVESTWNDLARMGGEGALIRSIKAEKSAAVKETHARTYVRPHPFPTLSRVIR